MNYNYRGIVVFGAPGSGKTTIARALLQLFPNGKYIEASKSVVLPAFAMRAKLPTPEASFIRYVASIGNVKNPSNVSREDARNFFTHLKNKYSPSVIAKSLIDIHQKKFSKKFLILAGIRGYKNSLYFKKNGYLVVYLKTPQ
jgi:uridine kinase